MTQTARLRALHDQDRPLLLPNAWDAASARILVRAGAQAVATSSASLSWSLGYQDGGALPLEQLFPAVRRIGRGLAVPLTVDIEDGYSDEPGAAAEVAREVAACGAAGINIEDGAGSPARLAEKIAAIRALPGCSSLFINARTDVYLRSLATGAEAVRMVIERAGEYARAGADGLFVPGLVELAVISEITKAVPMPLNLMVVRGIPSLPELQAAGVRRLSAGPATFLAAYSAFNALASEFLAGNSRPASTGTLTFGEVNALMAEA